MESFENTLNSYKQNRVLDFSSDGFIRDYTEEIVSKDKRRDHYLKALSTHLVTNKKPLDPDMLATFIVDLDGKVISSTDAGLLGRDVSGETYFSETMKSGSHISYVTDAHYAPEYIQNTLFDVSR